MAGYTKLSSSIVHSTIWREATHVKVVWITLLAISDKDGSIEASIPGLADLARVTIEECIDALKILSAPDPYSRTKECEGRRIMEFDGGWTLLNHKKYRDAASGEAARIANAERQKRFRESHKENDPIDSNGSNANSNAPVTDRNKIVTPPTPTPTPTPTADQEEKEEFTGGLTPPATVSSKKRRHTEWTPPGPDTKSGPTWAAYSQAYEKRYAVLPLGNAKTNAICCQLVDRLGSKIAPRVAAYYLTSNGSYHVQRCHSLDALLRDDQKFYTEMQNSGPVSAYPLDYLPDPGPKNG